MTLEPNLPFLCGPEKSPDNDNITLGQLVAPLWRRRFVFLSIVFFTFVLGFIIVRSLTPTFTSTAVIVLSSRQDGVVDMQQQSYLTNNATDPVIRAEVDALRSRTLVSRVIDREDLMNDPEFNQYARPFEPNLMTSLGVVNYLPDLLKAYFLSKPLDPTAFTPEQLKYKVASNILAAYSVSSDAKTYTVDIGFTSVDAEKARRVTNAFADEYLKSQIDERIEAVDRAAIWLTPRLAELSKKVERADRAVAEFKETHHIVDLPGEAANSNTLALQEVQNLAEGLSLARTQRAQFEAAQLEVERLQKDPDQTLSAPAVAAAPLVENLRIQDVTAAAQLSSLMAVYGERHPLVVSAKSALQTVRTRLSEEVSRAVKQLDVQMRQAQDNELGLQARMDRLTSVRNDESRVVPELRQLESEQKASKTVYDTFVQGLYRAASQDGVPTARGRIIQYADVLDRPTFPQMEIAMAVIFIAALMIAVGAVYALEAADKSFRSADKLEEALHLPVLGITLRARQRSILPVRARPNVSRQIIASPTSAMSESVRLVRTAITFSRSDRRPRVIMVTSAIPGEGKTTLALMLARQSALSGRRTILVEAEMRKPSFGKELTPLPVKGLPDYLLDCATLNEVIGVDAASGMHFIAVGEHSNVAGRPSTELLGSPRMAALLEQLSSQFDLVVLDTPPASIVADALQLGELVDAAILAVKWGSTPKHLVLDAANKLRAARAPLVGAVLTQVDARRYKSYGQGPLPYEYATGYYAPS